MNPRDMHDLVVYLIYSLYVWNVPSNQKQCANCNCVQQMASSKGLCGSCGNCSFFRDRRSCLPDDKAVFFASLSKFQKGDKET